MLVDIGAKYQGAVKSNNRNKKRSQYLRGTW